MESGARFQDVMPLLLKRRRQLLFRRRGEHAGGHSATVLEMFLAEIGFSSGSPSTHEIIVQPSTDQRTRNRNEPTRPLLDHFPASLCSDPLNDTRHKLVDHFF